MAEAIKYESSLPAILEMVMGKKTTTGGTSSTSKSSANIDPLMQVFQQSLTNGKAGVPEMTALIESIFREGATKVPELTQTFANATGSRTTGNSGLALAVGDLNRQLSTQAAQAILQNQQANNQIAGNAGANIAQATQEKTTTTSGTTSKTGAATNPLVPVLGGWLLNNFGKTGLDKLKNGLGFGNPDANAAPAIGGNPNYTAMDDGTTAGINSMISSMSPEAAPTFTPAPSFVPTDLGNSITPAVNTGFGGDGEVDFGIANSSDLFAPSHVSPGSLDPAGAIDFQDIGDMPDLDFSSFFADGGAVNGNAGRANIFKATQVKRNADAEADNPKPYTPTASAAVPVAPSVAEQVIKFLRGYADGGTVRNKNYTGSTQGTVPTTRAINYSANPATVINSPVTNSPAAPKPQPVPPQDPQDTGGIGVTDASNTNDQVDASPETLGGLAISGLSAALGLGPVGMVANAALGFPNAPMSPMSMGLAGLNGLVSGITNSMSNQSQLALDAIPQADIDAQTAATVTGMEGGLSGPAAGGSADSSNDAGQGIGGVDFNDGGMVRGPGTGTSDSVRVKSKEPGGKDIAYSDGEYVIPADVVRFFGTKHLDRMIAQVHQPAGV